MGKFVFLDLIGWGKGDAEIREVHTWHVVQKQLPRHWNSGSSYTHLSEVQAIYYTLLGVSTGA